MVVKVLSLASTKTTSIESQRWPSVGKYKVDVSSFESLALPELQVKEDTDLFIIDEVGKMELFSSSLFSAVLRVLESNIPLLATFPIPKSGRDIPGGSTLLMDKKFSHLMMNYMIVLMSIIFKRTSLEAFMLMRFLVEHCEVSASSSRLQIDAEERISSLSRY